MKLSILLTIIMSLMLAACSSAKKEKEEKKKEMAAAQAAAVPAAPTLSESQSQQMSANWNPRVKQIYTQLVEKYGQPNEGTESMFIWYNNGPWKRTVLHNEPGSNILEQVVDMEVPAERLGELALFNKSVVVDKTSGEVSSRSDKEDKNFLALNLGKEVIDGNKSAMEARRQYRELSDATEKNQYMDNLNFSSQRSPSSIEGE